VRLASDADFHGDVCKALLRQLPDLDLVSVREVGLGSAADPDVLAWAASQGRILLTHDRKTMTKHAYDRVRAGLPMPEVIVVRNLHPDIGRMVEDILLVVLCSSPDEWKDRVGFLPL
jgi:predicted nuclease of predicted toxin-antitoxin system